MLVPRAPPRTIDRPLVSVRETAALHCGVIDCSTDPDFVSSYDVDDYVYFFFRETAIEYINCGKVRARTLDVRRTPSIAVPLFIQAHYESAVASASCRVTAVRPAAFAVGQRYGLQLCFHRPADCCSL